MVNENNLEKLIPMIQKAFRDFIGAPIIPNIEVLDKRNSMLLVSGVNNSEVLVMLPVSSDNRVINVIEIDNGDNGDVAFSACVKVPYWEPSQPDVGDASNIAFALIKMFRLSVDF